MMKKPIKWLVITSISLGCKGTAERNTVNNIPAASQQKLIEGDLPEVKSEVTGRQLVEFAKTLLGSPYKYAASDPLHGFDCSGFITYVFNHFNIKVPRSSIDFTNTGKEVHLGSAREGDLILFTGTVDTIHMVGHMGIVTENVDTLKFIHFTSGKANGVTVSILSDHYKKRFVKVIRMLSD